MASTLLETASPFILLIPGFLPLLFFAHQRLICASSSPSPARAAWVLIALLGLLAALAASLGIAALAVQKHGRSLRIGQTVVQGLVELGYRTAILYLVTPRSVTVLSSRVSLLQRDFHRHNTLFFIIILAAFLCSILKSLLPTSAIPISAPAALGLVAALFPIPLIVHLALSSRSTRLRRIWTFSALLQMFSALASVFHVPQGLGYDLASAILTVLWGGGVITLFYTLSSAPLPPAPSPLRLPRFSLLSSNPSTPVHVHYQVPPARPVSDVIVSEDFTALRDPFASPPPVSPNRSIPHSPSPYPNVVLSPPPTPVRHSQKPPKPKAKESKPQRRGISRKAPELRLNKKASSHSLRQPLSDEHADWSTSEDAVFLSDEALLSQILLHSLTLDAAPPSAALLPPKRYGRQDEECSTCSGSGSGSSGGSTTTVRTRRDENGRRYASEQARQYDTRPVDMDDECHAPALGRRLSGVFERRAGGGSTETSEGRSVQMVVATREALEEVEMHAVKEVGTSAAWWVGS